jgi:hypothetical protein
MKKAKAQMYKVTKDQISILRYLESTSDPTYMVVDRLRDAGYLSNAEDVYLIPEDEPEDDDSAPEVALRAKKPLLTLVQTDATPP